MSVQAVVNAVKFHPVSKTHGYAVEKRGESFDVVFCELTLKDGQGVLVKEADARSKGRRHSYPSVFVADYAIRHEILPLYRESDTIVPNGTRK